MVSTQVQANRLYRYAAKVRRKIDHGELVSALADTAEAGEIARRLYTMIENGLTTVPQRAHTPTPGLS
jgi:hypothetical protein